MTLTPYDTNPNNATNGFKAPSGPHSDAHPSPHTEATTTMPSTSSDNSRNGASSPNLNGIGADGKEQRLIVVSNRLPVTISKDEKGEYHFKVSQ